MDENYNFRIIFKNDPEKHHRVINYVQLKKLIAEYFPKTLIVYRILSNFPDVSVNSKYGCTILVNEEPELVFTDPVYSVKTVEEYIEDHPNVEFRFRVQKVGLSTKDQIHNLANYKEEFCFDLNIDDVINKKDEDFIDSLLELHTSDSKKQNVVEDLKRNIIFTPEPQHKILSLRTKLESENSLSDGFLKSIETRDKRTEDELPYGDKKLKIGQPYRKQDDEKQIEMSFQFEDNRKTKDVTNEKERRSDQKYLRIKDREDENKDENDIMSGFSEDEDLKNGTFKKIQGSAPVKLRKMHINENGTETGMPTGNSQDQRDNLFSNFLKNLANESISSKIEESGKSESDILKLFKSVQNLSANSGAQQEGNKQVILKSNKNKDSD